MKLLTWAIDELGIAAGEGPWVGGRLGHLNLSRHVLDAWPFLRTVRTRNAAPRKLGNSCSNPVGDLIVVELSRYQAEERIAIQEIHQQLDLRFLGNFSAILCRLKRDRGESLTPRNKDLAQIKGPFFFEHHFG